MNDEEERARNRERAIKDVWRALEGLEFGEVILKLQNGKVLFVERHERVRIG